MKVLKGIFRKVIPPLAFTMVMAIPAFAADIAGSALGTGVNKMLSDATTYMMVICPSAGGLAAIFFLIRRSMADEQDGKMWTRRIRIAIICGVGGCLVGGIIALISSYFKG